MAQVRIDGRDLVVEIEGWDRLWALRHRLTVPVAHVRGATADPGMARGPKGWRIGGTRIPGVVTAGYFRQAGQWVFWDVRDPARAVVIELAGERLARLVLEVAAPVETVALVERHLTTA